MSFLKQLLAEKLLAGGHEIVNKFDKPACKIKSCCSSRGHILFKVISEHVDVDLNSVLKVCVCSCVCVCLSIAQRSAQELPLVEKQSVNSYPATGGKMMLLSGLNFLPESKVVFVEKAQGKVQSNLVNCIHILVSLLISLSSVYLFVPHLAFLDFLPVKIEQHLPASRIWCTLAHYIFNQGIFTFAEVSIACSLVFATSEGMNHNHSVRNNSYSHFHSLSGCPLFLLLAYF